MLYNMVTMLDSRLCNGRRCEAFIKVLSSRHKSTTTKFHLQPMESPCSRPHNLFIWGHLALWTRSLTLLSWIMAMTWIRVHFDINRVMRTNTPTLQRVTPWETYLNPIPTLIRLKSVRQTNDKVSIISWLTWTNSLKIAEGWVENCSLKATLVR